MPSGYRGRFAPSPTGPLHFGSLVAAVGSWLDARAHGGAWLVRIEDVDELRNRPGADREILAALSGYGLHWDEDVVWQTQRKAHYAAALQQLADNAFPCGCTRKQAGGRYPGTCRGGLPAGAGARTIRLRVSGEPVQFADRAAGSQSENLEDTCGDFVLVRADGLFAYQFAVVVDDALQGITDVVRGADLLDSTARQIYLQRKLGYPEPRYLHLPLALGPSGEKLSKQTNAPPIPLPADPETLRRALEFLGIGVAPVSDCAALLRSAIPAWQNRYR